MLLKITTNISQQTNRSICGLFNSLNRNFLSKMDFLAELDTDVDFEVAQLAVAEKIC